MSLIAVTTNKINRVAEVKSIMLNTGNIGELIADGTGSAIKYSLNKNDRRAGTVEYNVDEGKAAIDALWLGTDDAVISLDVLTKQVANGPVETYAKTISISRDKIAYGVENGSSQTYITVFPNANLTVKYLVDDTIAAIVAL